MSSAMAPTPRATSPTLSAIPAANWRERPPSARRRAASACAPITAGAPKASIRPAVMAASCEPVDQPEDRAAGQGGQRQQQESSRRPAHGWNL